MEAVAWSALGVLAATVIAAIFWLGTRIDGLGASLNSRIDAQGAALGGRIDALTQEVASLRVEQSHLSSRLDEHLRRHAS